MNAMARKKAQIKRTIVRKRQTPIDAEGNVIHLLDDGRCVYGDWTATTVSNADMDTLVANGHWKERAIPKRKPDRTKGQ